MAWVRIDDQFADHPKMAEVGPLGIALQISVLCYCNRFLTDGFFSKNVAVGILKRLGIKRNFLSKMVDAGLWHEADGGYTINGYLEYNPSKEHTLAKREQTSNAAKSAAKSTNEKRWGSPEQSPERRTDSDTFGDTSGDTGWVAPVPVPLPRENLEISKALGGVEGSPPKPPSFKPPSSEPPKTNGQFQPPEEIKLLANDLLKTAGIGDRQDKRDVAWDVYHACKADNEQIVHTLIAEIKAGEHQQANNIVAVIRARLRQ